MNTQVKCPHCGFDNNPGRAICWKCQANMTPPNWQSAQRPVQASRPKAAGPYEGGSCLATFCFLLPILGAIGGLYHLIGDEPSCRRLARFMLVWSAIGALVGLLAGIIIGIVAYNQYQQYAELTHVLRQ